MIHYKARIFQQRTTQ